MATMTPLRYKPKQVAELLAIDRIYLYALVRRGVFTPLRPGGLKGPGKTYYLDPREVEAYARGGEPGVKAYRRANRIPEPRGKRT